jgi:hypothetical protein
MDITSRLALAYRRVDFLLRRYEVLIFSGLSARVFAQGGREGG